MPMFKQIPFSFVSLPSAGHREDVPACSCLLPSVLFTGWGNIGVIECQIAFLSKRSLRVMNLWSLTQRWCYIYKKCSLKLLTSMDPLYRVSSACRLHAECTFSTSFIWLFLLMTVSVWGMLLIPWAKSERSWFAIAGGEIQGNWH